MVRKILTLIFTIIVSVLVFSQTNIYFKYDEAGNQKYRGNNISGKKAEETTKQVFNSLFSEQNNEEKFWAEVSVYPVPVKDILTIQWTNSVDEMIDTVSMYQFGIVNWNFQQKNIPNLNRQIQINMSSYYMGVYVLSFILKDGKVYTRNIIKQ